jgi:fido (protein-threonine AMPylation protein)
MARQIPKQELEAIIAAVARFPAGASIEELKDALERPPPHRTLQRRVAMLVAHERLRAEGEGRRRRYLSAHAKTRTAVHSQERSDLVLSPEAEAVRQLVSAPIQQREPVGYDRSFLDAYRPNESFYLSADSRQHLASLGAVPGEQLPPGTYLRQVFNRLLIDLSWNSSRLEGNTYSLLETEQLLELGRNAKGKDLREAQMILNHKGAIELLVEASSEIGLNRFTVCNLHALLAQDLLDPQVCGRVRSKPVGITGTVFLPLSGPQVLDECFDQVLHTAAAIEDIFEQAFFVMVHLPYLQPFEDVNKRVSRLAANIPLVRANVCPLSFVDVPQLDYTHGILGVYELRRVELLRDVFVWAYERSCTRYSAARQSLGEPDPFRIRYRRLLHDVVAEVVRGCLDPTAAVRLIRRYTTKNVPEEDRDRFAEIVETELMALHEGNIARYRLRPSEYHTWHNAWRT